MMKDIKVSIIVPAYNVAPYIHECLASLVKQTLEDIEILIIDNNSTDETPRIIAQYMKKFPEKIRLLNQPIQGPAAARNKGLEYAIGKYIGFVDGDDSVQPDMYEKLYNAVEKNRSDLVVCDWINIKHEGKKVKKWNSNHQTKFEEYANIFKTPTVLNKINVFSWNKLYRFELIKKINLRFDEELFYCEDPLFNVMYMFYAKNICYVREPLYLYNSKRINSLTATFNRNIMCQILFCKKSTEFYIQRGYFKVFESQLLWIIIGYFRRKLLDAFKVKTQQERTLAMEYITCFFDVLEHYYPKKWKTFLRQWDTKGDKRKIRKNFYLTHKYLLVLKIYKPKWKLSNINPVVIWRNIKQYITKHHKLYSYLNKTVDTYIQYRENVPVNEQQVLLSSFSGASVFGNMYYMAEDAIKKGYTVYIASNDSIRDMPLFNAARLDIKLLKPHSKEYLYVLATSKYLATDTRFPDYYIKRNEQILINTWHGTPLKYLGADVSSAFIELGGIETQFMSSDYLLFPNEFTMQKMFRCYFLDLLFRKKVMLTGYPRNAAFFKESERIEIKERLGLQGKKVYVYMPTWRGVSWSKTNKHYIQKNDMILQKLDDELPDDVAFFYKLHNYVMKDKKKDVTYKKLRSFPDNIEPYMLLNVADCLITDYSSVFFDFANTGKEIIIFAFDEEEYEIERGFYMPLDALPFLKITTMEELISHIRIEKSFIKQEKYTAFQNTFCRYDSALSPQNVNDVFLEGEPLAQGSIFDYADGAPAAFNVYFASHDMDRMKQNEIETLMISDPNALLVLPERDFSCAANALIKMVFDNHRPCIIARMFTPRTIKETILLTLYHKTGLFKKTALKICLREKERIFPNLTILRYTNLSNEILFNDITDLLQS